MADNPTQLLDGFTVTGDVPMFGDPFAADALPYFMGGGLSLNELAALNEAANPGAPAEAFAPPVPEVLPEVVVQPRTVPAPPPLVGGGVGQSLLRLIPWAALFVPAAGGPDGTGDAPIESSAVTQRIGPPRPPPELPDPILAEPGLPPNWADLARGGDSSLMEPVRFPGLPIPELPEFVVEPPARGAPAPLPAWPDLLPGSGYDFWLQPIGDPFVAPIGDPFGNPSFAPDPGPGSAPEPFRTPGVDPTPGLPDPQPFAQPGDRTAPLPFNPTAPDPFGAPLPDPFGDPFGDPFASPPQPAPPRATPRTPTQPGIPDFFADPTLRAAPDDLLVPLLTEFQPQPLRPNTDQCQCDKKKKEKKKKRRPRAVCYQGTYQQRAKTTVFRPTKEVPCDAPLPKKTGAKRVRKPTPTWNDTLQDVFYPQP